MSQYLLPFIDPDIVTGSQLAQWLNQWAPAIQTAQTGTARPASVTAGFLWLEQVSPTVWNYKLFDGTEDIILLTVNPTTNTVTFPGMGSFGTAAYADLTTSATDATAGRVTKVGDFGMGAGLAVTDANNAPVGSLAYLSTPFTNGPTAAAYSILTTGVAGGAAGQFAFPYASGTRAFYRTRNASLVWSAWTEIWNSANLVKTTSATDTTAGRMLKVGDYGAGVPINVTDANSATTPGDYALITPFTNSPVADCPATITVVKENGRITQMANAYVAGFSAVLTGYFRTYNGTAWSAWSQVVYNNSSPTFLNQFNKVVNHGTINGGAVSVDPTTGADHVVSLTGPVTVDFNTFWMAENTSTVVNLQFFNTGNQAITWPAGVFWPKGTVPSSLGTSQWTFNIRKNGSTLQINGYLSADGMVAV